jgi:GNAT superfamily N-acetyltransferase
MIREATADDLPAILDMVARLHEAAHIALPMHRSYADAFVRALMTSADGLVAVWDREGQPVGMLVASVGTASISPARVAIEHGWWVNPESRGAGSRLLAHYEAWARQRGCVMARMSTPPHAAGECGPAAILARKGYSRSEIAWVKVL